MTGARPLRALFFGTYDAAHPRNAQTISALRGAGVDVFERHVGVRGRGLLGALRVAAAETRLLVPPRGDFDVVIVGYPGHFDMPRARRVAGRKPLVFVPLVSLEDELVHVRRRFRPRSYAARVLSAADLRAMHAADVIVADTDASADFLAEVANVPRERFERIFVGAEERAFSETWAPVYPFGALHVAGAGASVEVVRAAAALAPELPVEIDTTTPYEDLGVAYARAGVAIASAVDSRAIPDAVFSALATGAPVVTADTAAARELLVDGESALLVPPGEPEPLAAALTRIAGDLGLRERLSTGGKRLYEERACEAALGAEWRALLERLTSGSSG